MRAFHCRLAVLFLAGVSLSAEQLPHVTAETLGGNKLELPSGISGNVAVLCIGFTHGSQTQTKPWITALHDRYQNDSSVAVYPVAVLEDAPRLVRGMILHSMKGGMPPSDLNKFLVLFQGEKEWKQAVGFEASDDAYLIVLDPTGAISYKQHGPANAASLGQLTGHVATVSGAVKSSK